MNFAIAFKMARESTPDPERPGKMLTQRRMAEILVVTLKTIQMYEQGRRLPHPIVRKQIALYFPQVLSATETHY